MIKKKNNIDSLIYSIIAAIEDIKGKKINILDLRDLENTVCDYFVVCEGNSNTQDETPELKRLYKGKKKQIKEAKQ